MVADSNCISEVEKKNAQIQDNDSMQALSVLDTEKFEVLFQQ